MQTRTDLIPSVSMPLTLRPDLVLLALPPRHAESFRGGLITLHTEGRDRRGLVLKTGDAVTAVQFFDHVIFDSFAAEEVTVDEWPCVLVPEAALDAVVESD